MIIQITIFKDLSPILYSSALYELKILSDDDLFNSKMYMIKMFRYLYNGILLCVIPYNIMTIDEKGEEGGLDLV